MIGIQFPFLLLLLVDDDLSGAPSSSVVPTLTNLWQNLVVRDFLSWWIVDCLLTSFKSVCDWFMKKWRVGNTDYHSSYLLHLLWGTSSFHDVSWESDLTRFWWWLLRFSCSSCDLIRLVTRPFTIDFFIISIIILLLNLTINNYNLIIMSSATSIVSNFHLLEKVEIMPASE